MASPAPAASASPTPATPMPPVTAGTGHNDTVAIDTAAAADDHPRCEHHRRRHPQRRRNQLAKHVTGTVDRHLHRRSTARTSPAPSSTPPAAPAVPGADLLADADKTIAASIHHRRRRQPRRPSDSEGYTVATRRRCRPAPARVDHRRRHPQRRRSRPRRSPSPAEVGGQGGRHRHPDGQRPDLTGTSSSTPPAC